jgi:hypothetical protein
MWKRRRTWLLLLTLIGVALALYFEPTHCVRGWLWGEAFYDGRPTSWWREELECWQAEKAGWGDPSFFTYSRMQTTFEKMMSWLPRRPAEDEAIEELRTVLLGPRVLRDKETVPVLLELKDDLSPKIREFARYGLRGLPVE